MVTLSPCQTAETTGSIWNKRTVPSVISEQSQISCILFSLEQIYFDLVAVHCNVLIFIFY